MNKQLKEYEEKINALSIRERVLIFLSVLIMLMFSWWNFYAQPLMAETQLTQEQNVRLDQEIKTLQLTIGSIDQRIRQGVHKASQKQLAGLMLELDRVNVLLQQKTLELIEPEEMFELMQQLLFAESKLKLTELKRKHVTPTFNLEESEVDQPEIYRHVMRIRFEGSYQKILNYLNRLEGIDWKLIWDRITIRSAEYPLIEADIEISTLSDSKHWVGL